MNAAILICTYGDTKWANLARDRAYPSALAQKGGVEVLVVHRKDASLAQVRNEAALATKREWLCFLDADDELAPGYIDAMSAALAGYDSFPESLAREMSRPLPPVKPTPRIPQPWPTERAQEPLLVPAVQYIRNGHPSAPRILNTGLRLIDINRAVIGTLIHRDLFLAAGGFHDLPLYEDWELWLRCVRAGAALADVPAAVYRAHVNQNGRNLPERGIQQIIYKRIRAEFEGDGPEGVKTEAT